MKVVIAMDSFKGSMTSMEAGNAAKAGILKVCDNVEVVVKPLADGGEGTTEALIEGFSGERVSLRITGPMGRPVEAVYGILPKNNIVIMEMAAAAGITLIKENEKNPLKATSFGVGEMIKDAMERGYREFMIGIGGSGTNDGGIGMLRALGYRFLNERGEEIEEAGDLSQMVNVDDSGRIKELKECHFQIACDVTNPLWGENGATYVFGPQKGVTEKMKVTLDAGMKNYAGVSARYFGKDDSEVQGTGAAGGLGFAFLVYLNAELRPGIQWILHIINLEKDIKDADLVITGEGSLDYQTTMGKLPIGVAKLAKVHQKKVLAFAGSITEAGKECNNEGIDAFFPIVRGVTTLEEAMLPENARKNMTDSVEQVFRLLCI
ncbi:MAG: glycerate kinase [Acetivibrio sp.]